MLKQLRIAAVTLACAVLTLSLPANADDPGDGIQLSWVRGEGAELCPSVATLATEVARRLGRDPFHGTASRSIETMVTRTEGHYSARIYIRNQAGPLVGWREQTSDDPDCRHLATSVALAISLVIDPDSPLTGGGSASPPAASPAPAAAPAATAATRQLIDDESPSAVHAPRPLPLPLPPPTPPPPPAVMHAEPHRRATMVALRAYAALLNTDASLSPAVGLVVQGPIVGPFDWQIGGALLYTGTFTSFGQPIAEGLTYGFFGPCATWVVGRVQLSWCPNLQVGLFHAYVFSPSEVSTGDQPWVALAVDFRLSLQIAGPVFAEVGFETAVPFFQYQTQLTSGFGTST